MSTATFIPACHGVMDEDVVGKPYVSKTLICCKTFTICHQNMCHGGQSSSKNINHREIVRGGNTGLFFIY